MVEQARERAIEEGLEEKVAFQIADALELPFEESTFDGCNWGIRTGLH